MLITANDIFRVFFFVILVSYSIRRRFAWLPHLRGHSCNYVVVDLCRISKALGGKYAVYLRSVWEKGTEKNCVFELSKGREG